MRGYSGPIHEVRTLVDRTSSGVRQVVWEGIAPSTLARHRWCILQTGSGAVHFAYYHGLPSRPGDDVPGFLATDLGVHAGSRHLGGQREECDILDGSCFYRGSQAEAADLLLVWSRHDLDSEWLWEFLAGRHARLFPEAFPRGGPQPPVLRRRCASLPSRGARRSQAASDPN